MSSVQSWYRSKNVFVTGGSGFLGVCLVEKLLRCVPELGTVYLLLRPKKGKSVEERLEYLTKNSVFERLNNPDVFRRVRAVAGDVGEVDLGLSNEDQQLLVDNVNVIFHSAATLDFTDGLRPTVQINLLGTRRVLGLAARCPHLAAFVHVSSAYVNSFQLESDEVLYPLQSDPDEIIKLVAELKDEELDLRTPRLLGGHPNTYTYTKHMAEHEVRKHEKRFPCSIVRPSMIVGAWKEPTPGWTISKNGPQGFLMGAAKGIIRRLPVGKALIYDYIPVDVVVNQMLVAACHSVQTHVDKVQIYHCTSSTRKPFRWESVDGQINSYLHKFPLKSAVWYPHLKLVPSVTWFKISAFFVHFLPALVLDGITKLAGGRPILIRLHRNVNASLGRLEKFIFTEFKFTTQNTETLTKWLSPEDQVLFYVDITSLRWPEYFVDLAKGVRVYLNNEKMNNIEAARGKNTLLMIVHLLFQMAICTLVWYAFACLVDMKMTQSAFVVPIFYMLYSLL